ncbi:MAG: hypothetical protein KME13_15675 [Myxacorys californica WJT36-NPBG1]|nr:hypothetical protein [Myxacorys californica WJT36-NPBG1]
MLLTLSIPLTSQVAIALDDINDATCNLPFDSYCTYGGPYDEPRGGDRDAPDPPEPYHPPSQPAPQPAPQPVPQPAPQPSGSDIPPICLKKPDLPQCL